MSENCYTCQKDIPEKQSWFEGHGKKVCLACYRNSKKCSKCKFPLITGKLKKGLEHLCEFCSAGIQLETGNRCFYCKEDIGYSSSHYEGHGEFVCQKCYQNIKANCFLCGFPVALTGGVKDPVCSFCEKSSLTKEQMNGLEKSLKGYLGKFGVKVPEKEVDFMKFDWKILAGMQTKTDLTKQVKRINQMASYVYPVYYMRDRFYTLQAITSSWFIPYYTSQLVIFSISEKFNLPNLAGNTPFHLLGRGWAHWVGMVTAKSLKYTEPELMLRRFQNPDVSGDFNKILAMSEYREAKELVSYVKENLDHFGGKYL